jgi:glycosyltransferase, family 1
MSQKTQTKPLETKSGSQEAETSSIPLKDLKVALVCDWLTVVGGAEQVLREIHHLFPSAPIYTSQYRPKGIDWFKDAEVKTGWINLLPAFLRRFIAPLRQSYFKHLDLTEYDLVISVSGCDAKYVKTKPGAHFCYCHVPTQYYWGKTEEYQKDPGFGPLNFFIRPIFKLPQPK